MYTINCTAVKKDSRMLFGVIVFVVAVREAVVPLVRVNC